MSRHPALQSKTPAWLASLFLALVLVLMLGVSASSLHRRFATSIPSRKIARLRLNCEAMPCNSLGRQSEELIRRSRRSCKATAGAPPISAHNPWLKKTSIASQVCGSDGTSPSLKQAISFRVFRG